MFCRILVKTTAALLVGGSFYAGWLALFLAARRLDQVQLERPLLVLAPVVTAAGFASGAALVERLRGEIQTGFFLSWVWALLGCAAGAVVIYWRGPMLIVFAMLVGGTIAVAYRDYTRTRSRRRHSF